MTVTQDGALARVALTLLTFATLMGGCAPQFTETQCQTQADCFSDEICSEDGLCVLAPPPVETSVTSFTIAPDTIFEGESTTLSWELENAASAVITAPGIEDIAVDAASLATGTLELTPASTTTYTLTSTSEDDLTDSATVTVTVNPIPAPTIDSFTLSPETVLEGESTTLSWTIQDADSAVITAGGQTVHTIPADEIASGSFTVTVDQPTTYTLTASSEGGDATETAQVGVQGVGPVIDLFVPSAERVLIGSDVSLSWQVSGADDIEIIDGAASPLDLTGKAVDSDSISVPISTAQSTFTLRATNAFGEDLQTVSVTGVEIIAIDAFTATPNAIADGQDVTLSWTISGMPESVELNATDSAGTRAVDLSSIANRTNASLTLSLIEDTTFELVATASNPAQNVSGQQAVTILPPPPIISEFAVDRDEIAPNSQVTLSWITGDADSVTIVDDTGMMYDVTGKSTDMDSLVVPSVASTRTFTFTATNAGGSEQETVTVTTGVVVDATLSASPTGVLEGLESVLTWTTTNATSLTITGPGNTPVDLGVQPISGGNVSVFPTTSPTATYTLTAEGFGGPITRTVDISVDPRVGGTFFSNTNIVPLEMPARDVTLTWSSSEAASISMTADVAGTVTPVDLTGKAIGGDSVVVNPTETTKYTLTIDGNAGDQLILDVTITVYVPAEVVSFDASENTIQAGESLTLSWTTNGATTLAITNLSTGQPVDLTGKNLASDSIDVAPQASTLYSLSVSGENSSVDSASQTITVTPAPLMITEVMYNPGGADDNSEWIEIYNGSDATIDLSNYSIGAGTTNYSDTTLALSGSIAPRGCILVGGPNSDANNGNPGLFTVEADFNPDLDNGLTSAGVAILYTGSVAGTELTDTIVYNQGHPGLVSELGAQDSEVSPGVLAQGHSIGRVSASTDVFEVFSTPTPGRCLHVDTASAIAPQSAPTGASGQVTITGFGLVPDLIEAALGATTLANCAAGTAAGTITCDYSTMAPETGLVDLVVTRVNDYAVSVPSLTVVPRSAPTQVAQTVADAFMFTGLLADPGADFGCTLENPGIPSGSVMSSLLVAGDVFLVGETDVNNALPAGYVVEFGYVPAGEVPSQVFGATTFIAAQSGFLAPSVRYDVGVSSATPIATSLFMRVSPDSGDSFYYCDGVSMPAPGVYGSDDGYSDADTYRYEFQ